MAGVGNGGGGAGGGGPGGAGAVKAGRAYVSIEGDDSPFRRVLSGLKGRLEKVGNVLIKSGATAGALGLAGVAPLRSVMDSLKGSAQLGATAKVFNLSAESASRLFGVMEAGGSDLRDATEGLATFNGRIADALAGKGDQAAELFQTLGVSAQEFAGLDVADRFYKVVDAINALPPSADKAGALMKAFGDDTGKNLIGVLDYTSAELKELGAAFQQSEEDLKAARKANMAYTLTSAHLGGVWREVVAALAPALAEFGSWLGKVIVPLKEFIKNNREIIVTAVAVAGGLATAGAALVGLGVAFKAGAAAIGGVLAVGKALVAVLGFALSPLGLLTAGVAGLGYVLATQTASGRQAVAALGAGFRDMGETFKEAWGGIKDAVGAGDLQLAFEIAGKGIQVIWYKMLAAMSKAFGEWIADNRDRLVALSALTGGVKGAMAGGRFGPWGALIGAGVGAGAGGLGTDATLNMLAKIADTGKLDARAAQLQGELAGLIGRARVAKADADAEKKKFESPGARLRTLVGSQGSFFAAQAAQRFNMPDSIPMQQLKEQKKIADATQETVRVVTDLGRRLAFG